MVRLTTLLKVSRPRLWLYTVGPWSLGTLAAVAGGSTVSGPAFGLGLLAMTIPINLFIYGLNDFYDAGTDAANPKKDTDEYRASVGDYRLLLSAIGGLLVCTALISPLGIEAAVLWSAFVLLVLAYNVPPVRAKARPWFDLVIALCYPLLGVVAYVAVSGAWPHPFMLLPIVLLGTSFHVYSAIHDMPHDAAVGCRTTALWLGSERRALWFCVGTALLAALSFMVFAWWFLLAALLVYPLFYAAHLFVPVLRDNLLRAYGYFIYLQYSIGFIAGGVLLWYLQ